MSGTKVQKQVDALIKAYAHDPDGLTIWECVDFAKTPAQAKALCSSLQTGAGGEITAEERASLAKVGFTDEFIHGIAGEDGMRALHERVKWLGSNMFAQDGRQYVGTRMQELGEIGPAAEAAVPALIRLVQLDKEWSVRLLAIETLSRVGPAMPEVGFALSDVLLTDKDWRVRMEAARTLGEIGPVTPEVIPALAAALEDRDSFVRLRVISALRSIGPEDAKEAAPALRSAARKDENPVVRALAADAMDDYPASLSCSCSAVGSASRGGGQRGLISSLLRFFGI